MPPPTPPSLNCPTVEFYAEVCQTFGHIDPLIEHHVEWIDHLTGITTTIPVPWRLGCSTVPLFNVAPGQTANYTIRIVRENRLSGKSTILMTRDVDFTNDCMGNDHMDDNFSASSYTLHFDLSQPSGVREEARVAVLSSGFFWATEDLAHLVGEPTQWINLDFDPVATAAQYPVLLIPSGGLHGLESSPSFRARLEEYARRGGTIIAFAQQHGYEYQALPGASPLPDLGEGPGVRAYGWAEDISCSGASLMMETWHPILSGLDRADVYAHVDGYFDAWPQGTQVLLSRKANGRPAAILWWYVVTFYADGAPIWSLVIVHWSFTPGLLAGGMWYNPCRCAAAPGDVKGVQPDET